MDVLMEERRGKRIAIITGIISSICVKIFLLLEHCVIAELFSSSESYVICHCKNPVFPSDLRIALLPSLFWYCSTTTKTD